MSRKTAIITGGNSGIGFQTARELARLGWRVIITGRDESKLRAAADAIGGAVWRKGDFASFRDVRALARALNAEPRIDVLVNNIGISLSRQQKTKDGNDMMLQVNHLAPFLLTGLLLDRLKASAPARIVMSHRVRMSGPRVPALTIFSSRTATVPAPRTRAPNSITSCSHANWHDGSPAAV
ncbi:MAG TPA: SDR family NAD(P)-dependent oxidoreductase [Burkholderiales bacterium]|nr:SDR family NAD(P)-dependent oxidoreductase [Burkholderiales bacterium]